MPSRLVRVLVSLLALSTQQPCASACEFQQPSVVREPSEPKASPIVDKMLAEAGRLGEAKRPLDSLRIADQAVEAAQHANDRPGAALAQQARARALQDLQRTPEALAAWQEAQQMWASSGDTPEQIGALVQAGLLSAESKTEAQRLFSQGLAVAKLETERPVAVAQALHDSGVTLNAQGQRQAAFDYLNAALAMREKLTPESLQLVETLNALAKLSLNRKLPSVVDSLHLAHDYSKRAFELSQRVAPDSSFVMESLHYLGKSESRLYEEVSNASDANDGQQHLLAALRIQKKITPSGSIEEADILADMGTLEMRLTNFVTARGYLEDATAISERLGPNSSQFGKDVTALAALESDEGDLTAAGIHFQQSLVVGENLHNDGMVASALLNLGTIAGCQYDFASAHRYFERALAMFQKYSPNGVGVLFALGDIADTFYSQGDLTSALEYRRRTVTLFQNKFGDSVETAGQLSGMGDILRDQGDLASAADYYHKALEMRQKLSPESIRVGESLSDLAKLERARRNKSLAIEYDLRALQLSQKSCPDSSCVPELLSELGELFYEQGDNTSSESYLRQAVDIREKSLGQTHPDLARSLNDLALTLAASGKQTEALAMALRAEKIGSEHLRVSVRTLSERQALAYEGVRASGLDLALSLTSDRASTPSAHSQVFDAVIRSRALVFDELAARHRSAYGSGDPEIAQLANQLSSARAQLSTLVFRGVGDETQEAYRKLLDDARERKEKAERMLAEKSNAFRQDQARVQLGLKEVSAALPRDTALLAFVRYNRRDFRSLGLGKVAREPVPYYAAFVLRNGRQEPELVTLGAAREIDSLLAAWRRAISQQSEATSGPARTDEASYRSVGAALRRRIWDPLAPALKHATAVFVVPDGALHLVSLASLPVGAGGYLVETKPLIHYLSTERDLVPEQSQQGKGILVVGNPAFDQASKVTVDSARQVSASGVATDIKETLLRGTRSACGTFETLHFSPLPGSQREAENIAGLWRQSDALVMKGSTVQIDSNELLQMSGAEASPEAFEQFAPGKRVLHVATHGFFLEGSCDSALQRSLDPSKRDESTLPATAENPLLLSGLAFAGANRRASAKPDESDGILTAEQIAGINLAGVDWAVLSACDTGVGEIKVGEGVFGLRRAFQVAGAKTVIMSLWPVEDETTRQWMTTLYREHFLNGKDTVESIRTASLHILREHRAKHQSTHPFYWGAFIAAGDWH